MGKVCQIRHLGKPGQGRTVHFEKKSAKIYPRVLALCENMFLFRSKGEGHAKS